MHHTLEVAEILESIFSHLDPSQDFWGRLLRPVVGTDWERPRVYTRRIKSLNFGAPWIGLYEVFPDISLCFPRDLFPQLQRFEWRVGDCDPSYIPLFACPTLVELSLGHPIASILSIFAQKCPALRDIVIDALDDLDAPNSNAIEDVSTFVGELRSLRLITVHSLNWKAVEHLVQIPAFVHLNLIRLPTTLPPILDVVGICTLQKLRIKPRAQIRPLTRGKSRRMSFTGADGIDNESLYCLEGLSGEFPERNHIGSNKIVTSRESAVDAVIGMMNNGTMEPGLLRALVTKHINNGCRQGAVLLSVPPTASVMAVSRVPAWHGRCFVHVTFVSSPPHPHVAFVGTQPYPYIALVGPLAVRSCSPHFGGGDIRAPDKFPIKYPLNGEK
ncbi:hypothetical protein B0H17DRAFT_1300441 [Mycena rosella]|uniref:Uncharacterized protein n=1 Tax=Mycena rosella TaxID=1033263 RepID=A0AAD7DBA5_MYCRO|nr:hypothetical protein B0H17DRAFT_1300441 [Mycena rosella]